MLWRQPGRVSKGHQQRETTPEPSARKAADTAHGGRLRGRGVAVSPELDARPNAPSDREAVGSRQNDRSHATPTEKVSRCRRCLSPVTAPCRCDALPMATVECCRSVCAAAKATSSSDGPVFRQSAKHERPSSRCSELSRTGPHDDAGRDRVESPTVGC